MRQIILDTETTGLDPSDGHRIIEIGCVEMVNRRLTNNHYHVYLNPNREIDAGAIEVHGITNEFLQDKPTFAQVVDDFIHFIKGADLVIHNAPFDIGFLNHELNLLTQNSGEPAQFINNYCTVTDTLVMARGRYPGQKNSLDALCRRLGVDNSQRTLHGALLDSEILADVYLLMTGGQGDLLLEVDHDTSTSDHVDASEKVNFAQIKLPIIKANEKELVAHQARLETIDKKSGGCIWLKNS